VEILNLIQCANLGGMEHASLRLMGGLKQRGHSLRLLSLNPVGQLGPLLDEAGIPHDGLPYQGKGGWRSYPLLKRKLRGIRADGLIMTGHNLLATLALGNQCRGRRILAIHFHHAGTKGKRQWQLIYRLACKQFDAITFPCDFIRKEAESLYPSLARVAHTVRCPLEMPRLPSLEDKAKARKSLGLAPDGPIVGNAGWLIPRKRFDVFLRVAKAVLAQNPKTVFAIAGDGPERASLESLARETGISKSVRWLGWLKDMTSFYQALDVLQFNSDWDALGLTPVEAMSFGIPVVCSVLNGGLGEVITSDDLGFLRSTHDVNVLSDLVLRLVNRPDDATRIGLCGRIHVEGFCQTGPIAEWHERILLANGENGLTGTKQSFKKYPGLFDKEQPKKSDSGSIPAASVEESHAGHSKEHVAIQFGRIGPYHFGRLKAAGKRLRITGVEYSNVDPTYDWDLIEGQDGFHRLTLFPSVPIEAQAATQIAEALDKTLNQLRPAAVAIAGWHDRCSLAALRWCLAQGLPAILMSETTAFDEKRKPWREFVKKRVVGLCAAGLVGGRPHAEYLASLGMAPDRVFMGYDAVDNDYFASEAAKVRSKKSELRSQNGLPENFFLASARFIEKKNLVRLIQAFARYREIASSSTSSHPTSNPWSLVLLGDGPLRADLCRLISDLRLQRCVLLPGFKQYGELPIYYGLSSAFIHASTVEQWGLVVNEAMASGLPVLVSNHCGCASDLVQEGRNGFNFDPYNIESLAQLMVKISARNFPLSEFASASLAIIADWGLDRFAAGLQRAVGCALRVPRPKPTMLDRLVLWLLLHR